MVKKRNFIIGGLLAAIVLMSVGYAALAQNLDILGTANVSANWDIQVTDIKEGTMVGATTKDIDFSDTQATFEVDLAYPGATAVYNVQVENKGTINAKLDSISGLDAINAANPVEIQYTVTGVSNNTKLAAGAKNTATVTVTWVKKSDNTDSVPSSTKKSATITLNYVQDTE